MFQGLLSEEMQKRKWFVMRAYKCEQRAEAKLSESGLEYFIPKRYEVRVYHGKKSKRLVPVIPSLIFVHATREEIIKFKKTHNFLQFISQNHSRTDYIIVPDREMEDFIKISRHEDSDITYFSPEEIDIKMGMRVRILGGTFDGVEGVFMKVKGKRNRRVVVHLDGVVAVAAEILPDLIEILPD